MIIVGLTAVRLSRARASIGRIVALGHVGGSSSRSCHRSLAMPVTKGVIAAEAPMGAV